MIQSNRLLLDCLPYSWVQKDDVWEAKFSLDGRTYYTTCRKTPGFLDKNREMKSVWQIGFVLEGYELPTKSNTGGEFQIFPTVCGAAIDFLTRVRPQDFTICGTWEEDNRLSLFQRILNRIKPRFDELQYRAVSPFTHPDPWIEDHCCQWAWSREIIPSN